jgi:prefoldin subunit 5
MAETKETKNQELEALQKQVQELQAQLQEVTQIANSYIQAHRDLLVQVRTAYSTSATLESHLAEKLK